MAEPRGPRGPGRWLAPTLAVLLALAAWEGAVRFWDIPPYLLPGPWRVLQALHDDFASLMASWWVTVRITATALALACLGGVGLATLFSLSRWLEWSLTPFAVVLQVTPVIAVAPLIMILTDSAEATVLVCAWIVAFFPLLANTLAGLRSADAGLRELFRLRGGAGRAEARRLLQLKVAQLARTHNVTFARSVATPGALGQATYIPPSASTPSTFTCPGAGRSITKRTRSPA